MKTLMNQLKFATLLTGFIFLSSCTGDATTDRRNSSLSQNNQMAVLIKLPVHPNHIVTAFPISFGTSGATLILN